MLKAIAQAVSERDLGPSSLNMSRKGGEEGGRGQKYGPDSPCLSAPARKRELKQMAGVPPGTSLHKVKAAE